MGKGLDMPNSMEEVDIVVDSDFREYLNGILKDIDQKLFAEFELQGLAIGRRQEDDHALRGCIIFRMYHPLHNQFVFLDSNSAPFRRALLSGLLSAGEYRGLSEKILDCVNGSDDSFFYPKKQEGECRGGNFSLDSTELGNEGANPTAPDFWIRRFPFNLGEKLENSDGNFISASFEGEESSLWQKLGIALDYVCFGPWFGLPYELIKKILEGPEDKEVCAEINEELTAHEKTAVQPIITGNLQGLCYFFYHGDMKAEHQEELLTLLHNVSLEIGTCWENLRRFYAINLFREAAVATCNKQCAKKVAEAVIHELSPIGAVSVEIEGEKVRKIIEYNKKLKIFRSYQDVDEIENLNFLADQITREIQVNGKQLIITIWPLSKTKFKDQEELPPLLPRFAGFLMLVQKILQEPSAEPESILDNDVNANGHNILTRDKLDELIADETKRADTLIQVNDHRNVEFKRGFVVTLKRIAIYLKVKDDYKEGEITLSAGVMTALHTHFKLHEQYESIRMKIDDVVPAYTDDRKVDSSIQLNKESKRVALLTWQPSTEE